MENIISCCTTYLINFKTSKVLPATAPLLVKKEHEFDF